MTPLDGAPVLPSRDPRGPSPTGCRFDAYAADYEEVLNRALSVSGENALYFARKRVAYLATCLRELHQAPQAVLDYGCGKGTSTPFFFELLGANTVLGVDASPALLEVATKAYGSTKARFLLSERLRPDAQFDLAFSNGVFHHIPPAERPAALSEISRALRPGRLLALWENNPWSPGARHVMSRTPFDAGAITLSAPECRRLALAAGFEVLRTDYLFIFPRFLGRLRPLEPRLSAIPLGAQYQVLCRKS